MKNTDLLAFKLLGGLSLKLNGEPLGNLASRKAEALLVYLACNQQEHSRESLATLLWDDRPLSRSLGNLSVLLSSLRKKTGEHVNISRSTLSFNRESAYLLDSQVFEEKISQARQQSGGQPLRTAAVQLTQALDLYQGTFLTGFHIREARDFEEWVILEQERLQRLAIDGLADLVDFHRLRGQTQEGIEQAARLLALDSLHEAGHRQMMRLLASDGRRNAALAQFETCRQILADELDVEPAEATVDLYEQIRSGNWVDEQQAALEPGTDVYSTPPARLNAALHNLPAQTTSFIGREHELSQITLRLGEPACRLLTLVGHGGIGKTRLALAAAKGQIGRFLHGVWFVGLAGLSSGEGLAPVIADTLGLAYTGRAGLEDELFDYLQQKEMLLVLDNFEHLLEDDVAPNLVQDILTKVTNITLLVTSRERLSLSAEWLVLVEGLPYPIEGDVINPSQYAAVQLFIQRAEQVDQTFPTGTEPLRSVQKICHLVQGMPLALELAASWLRVYSPEQVAERLEADLSFLSTRMRDVPLRHRSLQAIFDHSWQLLNSAEQTLFKRLAIFKGSFVEGAALAVTQAKPEMLEAVIDKSLVRLDRADESDHRFRIHEVLRQFAAVRLAEDQLGEAQTRERHAQFYAQFCDDHEINLKNGRVVETLELFTHELDNLQSAWRWAYSERYAPDFDLLGQMMEGFLVFFEIRGRYREGLSLIENASLAVGAVSSEGGRIVLGRLIAWQGWFNFRLSDYEKGEAMAEKGLAMIQEAGAWQFTAYPLIFLGAAAYGTGRLTEAQNYFNQSMEVYRQLDDSWGVSGNLINLGHVAIAQGDYEAAESHLLDCLRITGAEVASYLHSRGLQTLGNLYSIMGKFETASDNMSQALDAARDMGDKYSEAMALLDLGRMNIKLGNEDDAITYLEDGSSVFAEIGERLNEGWALVHLGDIAFKQGRHNQAYQYWSIVLQQGQEIKSPPLILASAEGMARLLVLKGDVSFALAIFAFIKKQKVADNETLEEAAKNFDSLADGLAADLAGAELAAAESTAAGWDIEGLVGRLQSWLV